MRRLLLSLSFVLSGFMVSVPAFNTAHAAPLPSLNVKQNETTVSGLSSGAYMAVQFHVANSSFVKGAGVIAGGPYFCAQDDQTTATTVCSCTGLGTCQPGQAAQFVPSLVQTTNANANQQAIDPTSNLGTSRVWLFSGSGDTIVPPPVMTALETYYRNYVPASNITFVKNVPAEHSIPTDSFGSACSFLGVPFINNCNFDAAGALLNWIYGNLQPRNTGTLHGQLIAFDQGEFITNPTAHGMAQNGWVYVPDACRQGQCRLHIAFHGCLQYPDMPMPSGPQGKFGDTFARHAGYNEWADSNNIVVLYPQANALLTATRLPRTNPNGCWDWWGYDDGKYAIRNGRQMMAVKLMVERLAGAASPAPGPGPGPTPAPTPAPAFCGTATNADHVADGRAHTIFFWWYFANGSGDFLGIGGSKQSTLKEVSNGVYQAVASCP
jgi:poly(3-hydroxybutyrate) depolymerase